MKLIHCSDLHLDAKMETGLDPVRARERRVELLMVFDRIVKTAVAQGAEAVLIAGDLFDTARASEKTRRLVGTLVADHPELQFVYVAGNHDEQTAPLFATDALPANWHAFDGNGWSSVHLSDNVVVSGTSAIDRPGIFDILPTHEGVFHIVLLHGQIVRGSETGGERIPLKVLRDRGIDYLALGHEHDFRCEPLDARGLWAYAGCPEGRGFDECGIKGCVLVDTDAPIEGRAIFLPQSDRTLHELHVSLDGCEGFGDVLKCVERSVENIPSKDMVKVVLCGALPPEVVRDVVHLRKMLEGRFYFARVKDECRLLVRAEDYVHDISLKGEFIRTVLASSMSDEQKQRTIECGLRALRGEEVDA